ncbi:MAG: hypothetical protein ACK5MV_02325 [Aminipila sp.]
MCDHTASPPLWEVTNRQTVIHVINITKPKVKDKEKGGNLLVDINLQPPLKLGWGNMYHMKDNNIVELTSDEIYKEYDINKIEYFVFPRYKGVDHVIGIMSNPLYKNK